MALGRTAKSTTGAHHCSSKPQPAGRVVASVKPSRLTTAVQVTARFDSHLNRAGAPAHRTLSSSGDSSSIAASAAASNWRTALDPSSGSNQGGAASWTPHSQGRSLAPTEARTNSLSSLRTLVVDGQDKEVMVRFCLKYRTAFGQSVRIIGSHPKLGAWSLPKALDLVWTEGDRWVATISLPTGCVAEYKYVLVDHDTKVALDWQNGSNSVLAIQGADADVEVSDNWGNNPGAMVAANGKTFTRESKLQKWAEEMLSYRDVAREAQTELARQTDTLQAIKAQVARLKMEMGMANKAKQDFEMKILELEKENVLLKAQVAQSQMAMKSTLEEAIRLLAQDEEDQEREEEEAQAEEEAAAAAHSAPSSASSDNGNGSFFGSSPWSRDAQPAYSYSRNGTSSSSSYSQTRMQAPSMGASGSGTGSGVLRNWRQDLGGSLDASSASSSSSSFGSGVGSSQRSTGGADYWRTFS